MSQVKVPNRIVDYFCVIGERSWHSVAWFTRWIRGSIGKVLCTADRAFPAGSDTSVGDGDEKEIVSIAGALHTRPRSHP